MVSPSDFRKAVKTVFKPLSLEHGFVFYKPLMLLRLYQDTLHIIYFDKGSAGFACDVAIQPLCLPDNIVSLSFGARLSRFQASLPERWDYGDSSAELLGNLSEVLQLVRKNALPWFNDAGSPQGFISFIESGAANNPKYALRCPPHLKQLYLAFCYGYVGRLRDSVGAFDRVLQSLEGNPFSAQWKALASEMRTSIANDPEAVEDKIKSFVRQTKEALGLDKLFERA